MSKEYLPVGSVVLLEGAKDKLMIIGRVAAPNGGTKIYDYAGCPYPGGLAGLDQLFFFDSEQIERLYFVGFQDAEGLQLQEYLSQLGELAIENGEIVERKDEDAAPEDAPAVTEVAPEPAEETVETAVFADVE